MEQEKRIEEEEKNKESQNKKMSWDIRPYLSVGLTVVLVFTICMAIFFFIFRFQGFSKGIGTVLHSLQSIMFGLVIAYLINPIMKFFERIFRKHMFRKSMEKNLWQRKIIRGLSVACALIIFVAAIFVLLMLVIPQLVISIQDLVTSMSDNVDALMGWVDKLSRQSDGAVTQFIQSIVSDGSDSIVTWLQDQFLDGESIVQSVTSGVYSMLKMVINFIIGLIVSVYVLMTKERFKGQAKKCVYAIFRPRWGNVVMEVLRKADDVFGGFFIGKIIDSIIIGIICFICLHIMNMPYTMLVSVIVGVTNIIPFFGPYIGAIPSAVLIFLVSPLYSLYFIIFIFILQQVDGNIIGPKILGDSTGLSPFWVIFAILLFGGCFGVVGMIFGVPIFALIYYILKRIVEHVLRTRKLPDKTADFVNLNRVDTQNNMVSEQDDSDRAEILFGIQKTFHRNKKNKK